MTGPPDLVVAGGTVLTPAGPIRADVAIAGGRIAHIDPPGSPGPPGPALDATGLLVAPGLVDLQCNGAVGVDLSSEPERLWDVAAALPRWGVTAWLPTIVTGPAEMRRRALAALRADRRPGTTGRGPCRWASTWRGRSSPASAGAPTRPTGSCRRTRRCPRTRAGPTASPW